MSDSMSQKLYRKSLPYLTHRKFVNEKKKLTKMNVNEKESFNGNGAFNETDSYIKNIRINYLVEILPKALLFLIKSLFISYL